MSNDYLGIVHLNIWWVYIKMFDVRMFLVPGQTVFPLVGWSSSCFHYQWKPLQQKNRNEVSNKMEDSCTKSTNVKLGVWSSPWSSLDKYKTKSYQTAVPNNMKERVTKLTYPMLQHCLRMLHITNGNVIH